FFPQRPARAIPAKTASLLRSRARLSFPRARFPFVSHSHARASPSPTTPLPAHRIFPHKFAASHLDRSRRGHHVAAAVVTMFQSSRPLGTPTVEIHLVGSAPARHRQLPVGIEEAGARHGQGMEFGWDMSQARSGT
ncbi:unnamed protein product, partial [Urochloa humidicola]